MPETKIEQVARALCDAEIPAHVLVSEEVAAKYRRLARAAIKAMRVPTEAMTAVIQYDSHGWGENNYTAMIDAALKEGQ